MEKPNRLVQSSPSKEGKHRRFCLRDPVRLKVHFSDLMVEFEAVSANIRVGFTDCDYKDFARRCYRQDDGV